MRKLFLFVVSCLSCGLSYAQSKIEITLNNDEVVKGVAYEGFIYDNYHKIYLKDIPKGEKETYEASEVKNVRLFDAKENVWNVYVPLKAQKTLPNIWVKNPKPHKNPIFLHPMYEGKNVSAYIHFISTQTNTQNHRISGYGWVYYFKLKNEDVAKAYWMTNAIGLKAELKLVFRQYPQMEDIIENLDSKEFYQDPVAIIRKFDEILK